MMTRNEFWIALHALCEAYDAEGLTLDERADNITRQFERMPPTVQREVLREFQKLSVALPDVGAQVAAAYRRIEGRTTSQRETG